MTGFRVRLRRSGRPGVVPASPIPTPASWACSRSAATRPGRTTAPVRSRRRRRSCYRFPDGEPMCQESTNLGDDQGVVRDGLDRPADPRRARRPHVGRVRWLRRPRPLHGRRHRPADPARRRDRRPDQGDAHRSTPTATRSSTAGRATTYFRVIAIDRPASRPSCGSCTTATSVPVMWNDDWDSSPLVIGDYLIEGEREQPVRGGQAQPRQGTRRQGAPSTPKVVWHTPSWDDELLAALASASQSKAMSVESSPTISGDVVYFTNSGGLVLGWDLSPLGEGWHAEAGVPLLDRRRHRRDRRRRREGLPLRRRPSTTAACRPRTRERPAHEARSRQAREPVRVEGRRPQRRWHLGHARGVEGRRRTSGPTAAVCSVSTAMTGAVRWEKRVAAPRGAHRSWSTTC